MRVAFPYSVCFLNILLLLRWTTYSLIFIRKQIANNSVIQAQLSNKLTREINRDAPEPFQEEQLYYTNHDRCSICILGHTLDQELVKERLKRVWWFSYQPHRRFFYSNFDRFRHKICQVALRSSLSMLQKRRGYGPRLPVFPNFFGNCKLKNQNPRPTSESREGVRALTESSSTESRSPAPSILNEIKILFW